MHFNDFTTEKILKSGIKALSVDKNECVPDRIKLLQIM